MKLAMLVCIFLFNFIWFFAATLLVFRIARAEIYRDLRQADDLMMIGVVAAAFYAAALMLEGAIKIGLIQ